MLKLTVLHMNYFTVKNKILVLLFIREMQLKSWWGSNIQLLEIVKFFFFFFSSNIICWGEVGATGINIHSWLECKLLEPLGETVVLIKLNVLSPYDSVILFLCIYLGEMKTYIHKITVQWIIMVILFVIIKAWTIQMQFNWWWWIKKLVHS